MFRRDGQSVRRMVRLAGLHSAGELAKLLQKPVEPPQPKKKPRRKDQPDEAPKRPGHPNIRSILNKSQMPKIVADHFEQRSGYANYHFNRINQDRIWQAFVARCDLSQFDSRWPILGSLESGDPVTIRLSEDAGSLILLEGDSRVHYEDDLSTAIKPPRTGGLLAALHVWHRLTTIGLTRFGEVYYLGTMPLSGDGPMADVLVGTYGGVETRFYFDPNAGDLLALEMFSDDDVDPCEIYFSQLRSINGHMLPHRLEIRHASATYAVVAVEEYQFGDEGEN